MRLICQNRLADAPILSICIPTWNRCDQLRAQLAAILPHLSPAIELVVFENGSTDDTATFLEQLAADHINGAFSFWSNEVNLGADVNYLRALEAGRGQWLWLLGDDDDAFDFNRLDALCASLSSVNTGSVLLYHPGWKLPGISPPVHFDAAMLMRAEHDVLAHAYLHVGMFLLRRAAALPYVRQAYRDGVGNLHAYSIVSLGLLANGGEATLVEVDSLFADPPPRVDARKPRWNAVSGHKGAWYSFEIGLPAYVTQVRHREGRLRAEAITRLALIDMAQTGRAAPGLAAWMQGRFQGRYRIVGWGVWLADKMPRSLTRALATSVSRSLGIDTVDVRRNADY